jgi:glucokinase
MILAGDIGGTKVNLALFELCDGSLAQIAFERFSSREFSDLESIIRKFISNKNFKPQAAAFGVAGAIKNGVANLTNLKWIIGSKNLARELDLPQVSLLNDLEANAYGISALSEKDFVSLNPNAKNAVGNAAVIAAGTGLGEAGMLWDGHRHHPFACEGGHSDFAAKTDLDIALLQHLRAQFGRVSWERVLSGVGSVNIYKFLRDTKRYEEPAWLAEELKNADNPAAVITKVALENKSELCAETLNLFVTYYGTEAANLALKMMSLGGVYIGGGIAPKIISKLTDGQFMKAFLAVGRMQWLVEEMPVKIILNDQTALLGAAEFARLNL